MAIDTLKVARRLRDAGFNEAQAEAVVTAVQEGSEGSDFGTKADLALLGAEIRTEITTLKMELSGEIAALRTELSGEIAALRTELNGEIGALRTAIEAAKADTLSRMMTMILSAVLLNIIAMAGLFFAFAKLPGH